MNITTPEIKVSDFVYHCKNIFNVSESDYNSEHNAYIKSGSISGGTELFGLSEILSYFGVCPEKPIPGEHSWLYQLDFGYNDTEHIYLEVGTINDVEYIDRERYNYTHIFVHFYYQQYSYVVDLANIDYNINYYKQNIPNGVFTYDYTAWFDKDTYYDNTLVPRIVEVFDVNSISYIINAGSYHLSDISPLFGLRTKYCDINAVTKVEVDLLSFITFAGFAIIYGLNYKSLSVFLHDNFECDINLKTSNGTLNYHSDELTNGCSYDYFQPANDYLNVFVNIDIRFRFNHFGIFTKEEPTYLDTDVFPLGNYDDTNAIKTIFSNLEELNECCSQMQLSGDSEEMDLTSIVDILTSIDSRLHTTAEVEGVATDINITQALIDNTESLEDISSRPIINTNEDLSPWSAV